MATDAINIWKQPLVWYVLLLALFVHHIEDLPFFWDSIQLASKQAHFFYGRQMRWGLLPQEIDSGHPPLTGYYLAFCWSIFGKTLAVSHWAMFPFLFGALVFLRRIAIGLAGEKLSWFLIPLVFLDPVFSTQATLVSPDIILVFFFLRALADLLDKNLNWLTAIALTGLCLVSMRGMMTAAALCIYCFWLNRHAAAFALKHLVYFIPGFCAAAAFLGWHWIESGWLGFHPDSPWSTAFQAVDARGIARNAVIVAWRNLDLGRCFEWLLLLVLCVKGGKAPPKTLYLWVSLLLLLSWSALRFQNLSAHRYFLPVFVAFHLLIFHWIQALPWATFKKKWLLAVLCLGMASGHFWVYPMGTSNDWDCTWAHLPYHGLRQNLLVFMEENNISPQDVRAAFPAANHGEDIMLNGDYRKFGNKSDTTLAYILISNVFNDYELEEALQIEKSNALLWQESQGFVWMRLYRKPDSRL